MESHEKLGSAVGEIPRGVVQQNPFLARDRASSHFLATPTAEARDERNFATIDRERDGIPHSDPQFDSLQGTVKSVVSLVTSDSSDEESTEAPARKLNRNPRAMGPTSSFFGEPVRGALFPGQWSGAAGGKISTDESQHAAEVEPRAFSSYLGGYFGEPQQKPAPSVWGHSSGAPARPAHADRLSHNAPGGTDFLRELEEKQRMRRESTGAHGSEGMRAPDARSASAYWSSAPREHVPEPAPPVAQARWSDSSLQTTNGSPWSSGGGASFAPVLSDSQVYGQYSATHVLASDNAGGFTLRPLSADAARAPYGAAFGHPGLVPAGIMVSGPPVAYVPAPAYTTSNESVRGSTSSAASSSSSGAAAALRSPLAAVILNDFVLTEHPSRTLLALNVAPSLPPDDIMGVFETFGALRMVHVKYADRGVLLFSYYDIRHAKHAMRSLQNHALHGVPLRLYFAIPREHADVDNNHGTLVVFNLKASVTNEELQRIFGAYGEIKEIRETPNKRHHRFVEYYDVRDAAEAARSLNKADIHGHKIKIESSRPGGARRSQGIIPDFDQFCEQNMKYGFAARTSTPITSGSPPVAMPGPDAAARERRRAGTWTPVEGGAVSVSQALSGLSFAADAGEGDGAVRAREGPGPWVREGDVLVRRHSARPRSNGESGMSMASSASTASRPQSSPRNSGQKVPQARWSGGTSGSGNGADDSAFRINLEMIRSGKDHRTTLMIKNIPNKYSQKMLLEEIDAKHAKAYDFFYLPIDFKNNCNVGYAFINFIDPRSILSFYESFNNRKWSRFNSEKICNLAWGRIQGKDNLVSHFRNSPLLDENEGCRPLLFCSSGPRRGERESFPGTLFVPNAPQG